MLTLETSVISENLNEYKENKDSLFKDREEKDNTKKDKKLTGGKYKNILKRCSKLI